MSTPKANPRTPDDDSLIQGGNWLSARLEDLIASHTPGCEEAVRLISDSLDRPLTLRQNVALRAHFLICCYCRRYRDQLRTLRSSAGSLDHHLEDLIPERLDEESKAKMLEHLRREL